MAELIAEARGFGFHRVDQRRKVRRCPRRMRVIGKAGEGAGGRRTQIPVLKTYIPFLSLQITVARDERSHCTRGQRGGIHIESDAGGRCVEACGFRSKIPRNLWSARTQSAALSGNDNRFLFLSSAGPMRSNQSGTSRRRKNVRSPDNGRP